VSGGLTRRMVVASGLLALVVSAAFAVLLVSVQDLRTSQRLALHSEEVLAAANQLERLVIDVETGQRGFVITGQERFLDPWRDAQRALPGASRRLEQLTADDTQHDQAILIGQAAAA
jgi:CHASE3 domain sensor protein